MFSGVFTNFERFIHKLGPNIHRYKLFIWKIIKTKRTLKKKYFFCKICVLKQTLTMKVVIPTAPMKDITLVKTYVSKHYFTLPQKGHSILKYGHFSLGNNFLNNFFLKQCQ